MKMINQDKNVRSAVYTIVRTILESEFSYIETPEDVYDLENYNYDDDLYNEAYTEGMLAIKDNVDDYEFENNSKEIEEDLGILIENVFEEVKNELVSKYNEKFEIEDMLYEMDEYEEY